MCIMVNIDINYMYKMSRRCYLNVINILEVNRVAIKLSSIDQFEQVIEENKYVFVLKHSETCPISANAYDQFNKFYMNAIWTVII